MLWILVHWPIPFKFKLNLINHVVFYFVTFYYLSVIKSSISLELKLTVGCTLWLVGLTLDSFIFGMVSASIPDVLNALSSALSESSVVLLSFLRSSRSGGGWIWSAATTTSLQNRKPSSSSSSRPYLKGYYIFCLNYYSLMSLKLDQLKNWKTKSIIVLPKNQYNLKEDL